MNERSEPRIDVSVHVDEGDEPPHSGVLQPDAVRSLVAYVLTSEGITRAAVGVVFCGDERITALNREWLDREGPTDVISFNLSGHPEAEPDAPGHTEHGSPDPLEGEIYIDLAQAARQASDYNVPIEEELRRLIIHGTLHLTGWEDSEEAGASRMRERQEALLADGSGRVLEDEA
ncbi:MAG: rRNA maturation RNase YbeY [bacterium]